MKPLFKDLANEQQVDDLRERPRPATMGAIRWVKCAGQTKSGAPLDGAPLFP